MQHLMEIDLRLARWLNRAAVVNARCCAFQVQQGASSRQDGTAMLTVMESFMNCLLAGSPDTLEFPSSWWDNSPESSTSRICQMLTNANYLMIPVYQDSVYFAALSALQRHFVGLLQRGQQQAAPAATGLAANQGNMRNTQPDNSSASPLCTAAASTSGSTPEPFCCKDCTTAHLVLITGHGAAMDGDSCTFRPSDRAAQTLRATLSCKDEWGWTTVVLLLRAYCCGQNLCITLIEASGTFKPCVSDKYLVQAVHVSVEAESSGEPIPLTVYLQQSREPRQLPSRNIKTVQAAHRVAHDHTHRDISADPKGKLEGGAPGTAAVEAEGLHVSEKKHDLEILAEADEELVLSRLFCNSDALPQGTTIELKRYIDRCYKNNETQLSTLSFDGWGNDPVLFKGQLLGKTDEVVTLQCSAVVNIAALRRHKGEKLLGIRKGLSNLWTKASPQVVVSTDRYISQDVKLCRAPAKISTEQL